MKRLLQIFLAASLSAAVTLSCTREKNYGDGYSLLTEPMSISVVPDYEDGAVDRLKGTLLFDVQPDWALDLVVDKNDLSIFSFDLLPVQTKGSESPCVKVTGASKVDGRLQLNVAYDGFALDTTFSACLKINIETIESISNAFNLRLEVDKWFEMMIEKAYSTLPVPDRDFSEVATDDAVTNVPASMTGSAVARYRAMAAGEWTASSETPLDIWDACYETIFITNTILNNMKLPSPLTDPEKDRLFGEAYGLRGIAEYYLLRNYSGVGTRGKLLGVPILEEAESYDDVEWEKVSRSKFDECVEIVAKNLEGAVNLLPQDKIYYRGSTQSLDKCIVLAFYTRLLVLAASPAFLDDKEMWERAADCSGKLIALIERGNTPYSLPPDGRFWFEGGSVDNTFIGPSPCHGFWCVPSHSDNSLELNNLPPSFGGRGEVNPSQDLVNAFGMANGLPAGDPESGYDETHPYMDRGYRMYGATVFQHEYDDTGSFHSGRCRPIAGASVVKVGWDPQWDSVSCVFILRGDSDDITGKTSKSTRTGYYLRKPLREDVKTSVTKPHAFYRIRLEEVYLSYAEAGCELQGATYKSKDCDKTAEDAINVLRNLYGDGEVFAKYTGSQDGFRSEVRRERRIELCFDGVRFWDLRRWKDMDNLNKTVTGGKWDGEKLVSYDVEKRNFKDYMIYCPIPQRVLDKCPDIEQNKGW